MRRTDQRLAHLAQMHPAASSPTPGHSCTALLLGCMQRSAVWLPDASSWGHSVSAVATDCLLLHTSGQVCFAGEAERRRDAAVHAQ